MAKPSRFPAGLTTFPSRSIMGTYPISTSPNQITKTDDFLPYRAGDYTVTTAVAGTIASFPFNSGAIKMATSASATDTIYAALGGAGFVPMQGNAFWMDFKVAYPRTVQNANDTNIYLGWFDNVNPAAANNGIYFLKPSGGTAVNFIIKKAGVVTTFQNIADLAVASGLFGDTQASVGLLSATVAGGAFTGVSVSSPGAGYQTAPLTLTTITSGVAGNQPVFVQLGSTAINQANPPVPVASTGLPYGSLLAPYIVNPGSGYTNAGPVTTYLEVEPLIDLQCYFDGKGRFMVGVNGRAVMSITGTATELGVNGIAAGGTVNLATTSTDSFYSTTQLTTAVAPFQPPAGSAFNLFPTVPLNVEFGFSNTTANIRTLYVMEYNAAVELN